MPASCGFSRRAARPPRLSSGVTQSRPEDHRIPASQVHQATPHTQAVVTEPRAYRLYTIKIRGRLGSTALSGFPSMVSHASNDETVLTGLLEDWSALFGVIAQVEALGLDLIELREIQCGQRHPKPGDDSWRHI